MKAAISILAALALSTSMAHAAAGMFGGYVVINSGSSTVYGLQEYGGPNNVTDFQGFSFGNLDPSVSTLSLTNASGLTFKNTGSDVFGVTLNYRVYKVGDTPGSFLTSAVSFGSNATSTDIAGNTFSGSGDQEWRGLGSSINLLGLASSGAGTYNVEVFLSSANSGGTSFINNGGPNYIATFAVPEPSKSLLMAVGLIFLVVRRRR